MDNNDLYFQSITGHEEELALGRNRQQFLHKQICTRFEPYRQHFLAQPVAIIRHSQPKFTAGRSMTLRDNMKVERQVKYVKSTVVDDYGQEVLQDLLGEESYQPVKRLKNVGVVYNGKYYWAQETKIKYITITDFLSKSKLQGNRQVWSVGLATPIQMMDTHEWIYQLTLHNSLFYVRTPRRLMVIDPVQEKIVQNYTSESEIINFHHYFSRDGEKIILTTYKDKFSQIFQKQLHSEQKMQLWCQIDGLINALWTITDSEVLICKENAILLADRRRKAIIDLHRRAQCHNNRIYAGISLEDTVFGPRYFLTTESKEVNIYDIRKAYQPVQKIQHYCEEAPPSILQVWNNSFPNLSKDLDETNFDQFLIESLQYQTQNPILIAHSPYATGASLFTQLSIDCSTPQEILRKQALGETNQFTNRFQLLYDPGKLYEHYHPRSITPIALQLQVGFIHLDNYNGISFQIFEKIPSNQNIKVYKRANQLNEVYQRIDFMKQEGVDQLKDPNMEWYGNYTVEKQLQDEKEDYWAETMQEDQLQLEGNLFEKKVIRYADLKKFYHQVLEQAKTYPLSEKLKEEESTVRRQPQPESQSQPNLFSQSQTQASQSITQALSCKLSPSTILSLLEQWNP